MLPTTLELLHHDGSREDPPSGHASRAESHRRASAKQRELNGQLGQAPPAPYQRACAPDLQVGASNPVTARRTRRTSQTRGRRPPARAKGRGRARGAPAPVALRQVPQSAGPPGPWERPLRRFGIGSRRARSRFGSAGWQATWPGLRAVQGHRGPPRLLCIRRCRVPSGSSCYVEGTTRSGGSNGRHVHLQVRSDHQCCQGADIAHKCAAELQSSKADECGQSAHIGDWRATQVELTEIR